MASTFTTSKHLEKPANGDDVDTWDVPVNADWDAIDAVFGGSTAINVVGISGVTSLTFTQYRPQYFVFSGLLTANVNYQLPSGVGGVWTLLNLTTGAFTITFSSAGGGTSVLVPRSSFLNVRSDGTNIFTVAAAPGANSDITSLNALGLTGVLKGTGAAPNPVIAAIIGTDYVGPSAATTFTAAQTFAGSSSVLAALFTNTVEIATITTSASTGTIPYYPSSQSILHYTLAAAANWTINLTFSAGTTLNTAMSVGQSISVAFLATQGASPYFNNIVQVDGTTSGVTTRWQGGAPVAGFANGIDIYTYTIMKVSNATFNVFATQTQFK